MSRIVIGGAPRSESYILDCQWQSHIYFIDTPNRLSADMIPEERRFFNLYFVSLFFSSSL